MANLVPANFPMPGRGAWTQAGGLLPLKPGNTNKAGYYRLAQHGETPIGSVVRNPSGIDHDKYVVQLGVKSIQGLVGAEEDGWFGPATDTAVRRVQDLLDVHVDGIVGRGTMRALLDPVVIDFAAHNDVPAHILGGLLLNESALDPAAVGVNGADHGLAQINLAAHPSITIEQACDWDYAITFAVEELHDTYRGWVGRTKADPWDIAIAWHNSPLLAKKWGTSGFAPVVPGRVFQIQEYVDRVKAAW